MKLSPTVKLKYKKALLKAGIKVGGLNDNELEQEYLAINGEPIESQAAASIDITEDVRHAIDNPETIPETLPPVLTEVPVIDKDGDIGAQLIALIAAMVPKQTGPALDEKQLVKLIKQHATKTIILKQVDKAEAVDFKRAVCILFNMLVD